MLRSLFKEKRLLYILASVILLTSCAGMQYFPSGNEQKGIASWYGTDFHGKTTSNKEIYNMHAMTAAHKTLPFGTYVRVTNLNSGKSVIVRINDRGPFVKGRIIDLSYAAAKKLGMSETGVAPVKIKVLRKFSPKKSSQKYSVQVGAFTSKKNASTLQWKLQKRYNNVYIKKYKTPSQTLYRVRIRASSMKSAQKIAEKLSKMGYKANVLEEY
ncbi:MAG: septal ring lytic transglycosylase RlpA family protein [Candidatus Aminicenantes bacterium]|nr:septal ring lytic transglycosylase RlpA family protein [Candidatus Aminicenantes bacterium]